MFKPDAPEEKPNAVPRANPEHETDSLPTGMALGAFAGYLRRPKSSSQGLTAQIFGENGADADTICALHLTRYQDALVKVSVWGLKDKEGRRMKDAQTGQHPLLTEFIARVKRPAPSLMGQTALFFGENGPNSDAINLLNQTRVLDSLVYVEITKADPGQTPADIHVATPEEALAEQESRLTPQEKQAMQQQQRRAAEALKLLRLSRFFQNELVWGVLGSEHEYVEWLGQQVCCHPGTTPCENTPVVPFRIPGGKRYQAVPLCREHVGVWERGEGQAGAQNPLAFLDTRQTSLVQRWSEQQLRKVLRVPQNFDPTPAAIYDWALQNNLARLIPRTFDTLL